MAASGDGLRRPLNAPDGGQALSGVQPGTSNGITLARLVIISGPAGSPVGEFVYAAGTTPGLGNSPIAWQSSSLVDPFGNVLKSNAGAKNFFITQYLTMEAAAPPAAPATNDSTLYVNDFDGAFTYVNGNDGGTYRTGRAIKFGDSGQLINSTSPANITGMAVPVAVAGYHIQGWVNFTGTGAVGQAVFGFAGGATVSHADGGAFFLTPGAGLANPSVFNGALAVAGSPTLTGGHQRWEFDVFVVISGGTSFQMTAQEGVGGDSFTVDSAYIRAETF
jgi:hypothetical protein